MSKSLITGRLETVKNLIDVIINQHEKATNVAKNEGILALVEACEVVDRQYKTMCDELDEEVGDVAGMGYERGISIEFYIEASDWHDISIALRKIKETM